MDEGKAPGTLRVCRGEKTANYFIGVLGNLEQGLIPAEGSGDPALSAGIPPEAVSVGNPERGGPDPVQPGSIGCPRPQRTAAASPAAVFCKPMGGKPES